MKAIILAGGNGTRLHPVTAPVNKHLLPVYDKPMIYYPLSLLMLFGIKEIMIISKTSDIASFRGLLGDGSKLGIKIEYAIQDEPRGIADAFIIAENFIGKDSVTLILGDNIFYGENIRNVGQNFKDGAKVFLYRVSDPKRYGVAELHNGKVIDIIEKPENPKSNWAVTGLYMYDNRVVDIAKKVKPSARGELEITSINNEYIKLDALHYEQLNRGVAWFDVGTVDSLLQASVFVHAVESRQGIKISCIEEVAEDMGFIDRKKLQKIVDTSYKSTYGEYLKSLLERDK
jgi:glucose-1-phosphate thymidylyltransferase